MEEMTWSTHEFGRAKLGDMRRTERLIAMGSRVAEQPAGNITAVFGDAAEREAAFRLVENEAIEGREITSAAGKAAAERAKGEPFVLVPIDGSSLNLPDQDGRKRFGSIG